MPEDLTINNQNIEPTSQTPEDLKAQQLQEAAKAVAEGTATESQQALVDGFEAGAQAHSELANNQNSDLTNPDADSRVISGDLLDATNDRIARTESEIDLDKGWGIDITAKKDQLQADKDMKAYLEGRPTEDSQTQNVEVATPKVESVEPTVNAPVQVPVSVEVPTETAVETSPAETLESVIENNDSKSEKDLGWENQYKDLTMDELLNEWAEAEDFGDRTKSMDIQDVIQDKLINVSGLTQEHRVNLIDTAVREMNKRRKGSNPEQKAETKEEINEEIDQEETELSLTAGKAPDILKEIDRLAGKLSDQDRDAYKDKTGIRKIFGWVKSVAKHNNFLELETKRRIASNLMESLQKSASENGREFISFDDLDKMSAEYGLSPISGLERGMLESIADGTFGPGDALGKKISGEGKEESEEIKSLRAGIKASVLDFVSAVGTEGLSDADRDNLLVKYQTEISNITSGFIGNNEEFSNEFLTLYADNARELLTRSLATSKNDNGIENLTAQLDSMKIDIGERQIGASNNADTKYLERTVELQRKRNTASTIGKTAAIAGLWAGAMVTASTLSSSAAAAATQAGASKIGTVAGATLIAGPVGGFLATVGIAAYVGKVRGEKIQSRDEDLRGVESAYGTQGKEAGASDNLETYSDASEEIKKYMVLRDGVDSETSTDRDLVLRTDLSQEEIIALSNVLSRIGAKLDVEAEYNTASAETAEDEISKSRGFIGGVRSSLKGQSNPDGRALALFSSSSREDYLTEQTSLFRLLSSASKGLKDNYSGAELSLDTADSEGQSTIQKISLEDYLEGTYVANKTEAGLAIDTLQDEAGSRIKQAGKRGAITGAIAAGVVGLGVAGTAELISGGKAATIFDALGARPTPETISAAVLAGTHKVSGANELFVQHNYGQSGANIKNNVLDVVTPSGNKIEVPISANGSVSSEGISKLAEAGVTLTQESGSKKAVSITDFMLNHGGKKAPRINEWLNNNTSGRYDGTELGTRRFNFSNGDLQWSQDLGTASRGNTVVDLAAAGRKGEVSILFKSGNSAIEMPLVMKDGKLVMEFQNNTELRNSLFTKGGAFRGDLVQTIVRDPSGEVYSVAAAPGLGQNAVSVTSNNLFELTFEQPVKTAGESLGYTFVAPVPTRVSSQFEKIENSEPTVDNPTEIQPEETVNTSEDVEPTAPETATPETTQTIQEVIEQSPDRTDKVDVEPLDPKTIVERLEEDDKKGTHLTVNGERLEVTGTDNGKIKLKVIEGERNGQDIEMEAGELEQSVSNGLVLIDGFLGANNAEALYDDFQTGEIVYDSEIESYVRVEKIGDNFRYIELDENGKDKLGEPFSNPRVYMKNNFIYRLQHGTLVPVQKRGVQTLENLEKAA
jgi:hypothetical protein